MNWLPIETAPNNTWVLVWCRNYEACVIATHSNGHWYDENDFSDLDPSHWISLPPPPK